MKHWDPSRTALVTGAAGFIGSHVVENMLKDGMTVHALDHPNAPFDGHLGESTEHQNLVLFRQSIREIGPEHHCFEGVDYVIHCASLTAPRPSLEYPFEYLDVNLMGLIRVLEGARRNGNTKVVNISSGGVYGSGSLPFEEGQSLLPEDPYCLSKWFGEEACLHWAKTFNVPTITLRLFHPYGPRAYGPIANFVKQRLAGDPITLFGDGSQERDFSHVRDVAQAILLAATSDVVGEIYNVSSGKSVKLSQVAQLIGGEIRMEPRPQNEVQRLVADNSKIQNELGWKPTVTLEQGISELLEEHSDS